MVTDVQMFETLTVRPEGLCPTRLSPGTLAEALLFYGCVRVDADVTLLRDLLSQIDTSIVVNLLRSNSLLLRPFTDVYGVQTYVSVCSLMGPLLGEFCRIMGPALLQHDGATRGGAVTRLLQGHGASSEVFFAASWGQFGLSDLK